MGLIQDIGAGPVALDTSVFVYFIEAREPWLALVEPVFEAVTAGGLRAVTSAITLLEVLVLPLRMGDRGLAARYEALLRRGAGLSLVAIDARQLRAAASLRARFATRTPDALQLAAAASFQATSLLTNDRRLPALPELRVLQLGDYL